MLHGNIKISSFNVVVDIQINFINIEDVIILESCTWFVECQVDFCVAEPVERICSILIEQCLIE